MQILMLAVVNIAMKRSQLQDHEFGHVLGLWCTTPTHGWSTALHTCPFLNLHCVATESCISNDGHIPSFLPAAPNHPCAASVMLHAGMGTRPR